MNLYERTSHRGVQSIHRTQSIYLFIIFTTTADEKNRERKEMK